MRRTSVFLVVGAAVGLLVAVIVAELSVRLFAAVSPSFGASLRGYDPMAVQIEPVGDLGYRQRANSVFHYANGTIASANSLGYRGPVVSSSAAPGTIRIVLLGGSTTHGFGVPDSETIDTYMREELATRHPASHFEVVNLAFDGYDSYQLLQRFRAEGVPLHPDIVFVNEGINDVRDAWFPHLREADPRTLIWEAVLTRLRQEHVRGGPSAWTLTKHYFYVARTPGYIREQLVRRFEQRNRSTELAQATQQGGVAVKGRTQLTDSQGPPYPDAAAFFDRHIRELTELAVESGASVVLSTPPSSLRDFAPTATSNRSYWVRDAKTTQDYRDVLAKKLQVIARDEELQGHGVRYIAPTVPRQEYLDDCHLTGPGNKLVARAFVDAVDSILPARKAR